MWKSKQVTSSDLRILLEDLQAAGHTVKSVDKTSIPFYTVVWVENK